MDEQLIVAALAQLLETESRIKTVHEHPPESFGDTPAAVLLETSGSANRDSYRGGWSSEITVRLILYVTPRTHLPEAVQAARQWAAIIMPLLAENDTLIYQPPTPEAEEGEPEPETPDPVEVAELLRLDWTTGVQQYGKTMYTVLEVNPVYRLEWGVTVGCGLT